MPSSLWSQYFPVNARSVPFSRVTEYSTGVSCCCHSAFDFLSLTSFVITILTKNMKVRASGPSQEVPESKTRTQAARRMAVPEPSASEQLHRNRVHLRRRALCG